MGPAAGGRGRLFVLLAMALALRAGPAAAGELEDERARAAALERRVGELERELAAARACDPEGWRRPESWQRLHRGMSRFEVLRLLGEPGKVASYDGFERWEYPDLLGGRVSFDDRGALQGWRAPPPPAARQRSSGSR